MIPTEATGDVRQLVVVGASLAGVKAVRAARAAGYDGQIVLVGDEEHLPYDRPPLSKQFLAEERGLPHFHDAEFYADELDATLLLGTPASSLLPAEHVVVVGGERVRYDALVLATGATPRVIPEFAGTPGVHTLRNVDDAAAIRMAIDAGRDITILGAGFIGAEIASAARKSGCRVTIVEASMFPLERALGKSMGRSISAMHGRNGVDLRCGVTITKVSADANGLNGIVLSDGTNLRTDILLVSIGAVPATAWLEDSGISMSPDGGVVCNEFLETSLEGVFAAGDIAYWPNSAMGSPMRLEHWTSANEQGAVAGRNAIHPAERTAYSTVPYFWSDWYGNRIQFAGKAGSEEPEVVFGALDDDRFVALYRSGDRLIGALAVNEPSKIMKDRRRIAEGTEWKAALAHYESLREGVASSAARP
ncbi:FAD-dependent oxidoreductase [soil metagenome]